MLMPGDIITFDISLAHASGEDIYGLGVGVAGHDSNQNGLSDDGLTFLGPNQQNSTIPDFVPVDTSGTTNVADFIFGVDDGTGNPFPGTGLTNVRGGLQTPTFSVIPPELTGLA